jgi:hypothetical protein
MDLNNEDVYILDPTGVGADSVDITFYLDPEDQKKITIGEEEYEIDRINDVAANIEISVKIEDMVLTYRIPNNTDIGRALLNMGEQ